MAQRFRTVRVAGGGVLVFFLLLGGALFAQRKDAKRNEWKSPLKEAPARVTHLRNPYEGQRDAVLAGRKLFRRHCVECHGADARGSRRAPSLRAAEVRKAPPGVLFWFLTNGNLWHGMPSWSGLPAQRRWQIVSYLKSLGRGEERHQR